MAGVSRPDAPRIGEIGSQSHRRLDAFAGTVPRWFGGIGVERGPESGRYLRRTTNVTSPTHSTPATKAKPT